MTRASYLSSVLDSHGHPLGAHRYRLVVPRDLLTSFDFLEMLHKGIRFQLSLKEKDAELYGQVVRVCNLISGTLIHLELETPFDDEECLLNLLWIPNTGTCGIM